MMQARRCSGVRNDDPVPSFFPVNRFGWFQKSSPERWVIFFFFGGGGSRRCLFPSVLKTGAGLKVFCFV